MTPDARAAEMLTRKSRKEAIATAERIVETRGGTGPCAAFWSDVLRALVDFVGDESTAPREDDVFSFSASVMKQMGRSG